MLNRKRNYTSPIICPFLQQNLNFSEQNCPGKTVYYNVSRLLLDHSSLMNNTSLNICFKSTNSLKNENGTTFFLDQVLSPN